VGGCPESLQCATTLSDAGVSEETVWVCTCTEEGLREAVSRGGEYRFECLGDKPRLVTKAAIVIDKDVVLVGTQEATEDPEQGDGGTEQSDGGTEQSDGDQASQDGGVPDAEADGDVPSSTLVDAMQGESDATQGHSTATCVNPESPNRLKVSGAEDHAVFIVDGDAMVELKGFGVTKGLGAGVVVREGALILKDSNVFDNFGTGIRNEEAGRLRVVDSWITSNDDGVQNEGTLFVNGSHISANSESGIRNIGRGEVTVSAGTVISSNGTGLINEGSLEFRDSCVTDHPLGRGITTTSSGESTVTNSRISGNQWGVVNEGAMTLSGLTEVKNNSTVGLLNSESGTLTVIGSHVFSNRDGLQNNGTAVARDTAFSDNEGVGIHNTGSGELSLSATMVERNALGILNEGELVLSECSVSNSTQGGVRNLAGANMDVESSTFSSNAGSLFNAGELELEQSTISTDRTIVNRGDFRLTNSTVSNVASDQEVGMLNIGGTLELMSATVYEFKLSNEESDGDNAGTFRATASVMHASCTSKIESGGYNVASPADNCELDEDEVVADPETLGLCPLEDYGGLTYTHALSSTSEALDRVPVAHCVDIEGDQLLSDQRGTSRPQAISCDAGAVERSARDERSAQDAPTGCPDPNPMTGGDDT